MTYNYLASFIQQEKEKLSATEGKIADHFLELDNEVVNKTLTSLAEEIGVSEASIYKFVKKLGFDGFQDFKIQVASNLRADHSKQKAVTVLSELKTSDKPSEIAQKIINYNIEMLNDFRSYVNENELEKALDLMYSCSTFHFFGSGGASVLAFDAYHKFLRSKFQCSYVFDYHFQLSQATKLGKNDLAMVFSHSGNTHETMEITRILKENGVKIITFTGNPASELVKLSDLTFFIYTEEAAFHSEALTSTVIYSTIMDILFINLMFRDQEENRTAMDGVRKVLGKTRKGADS